MKNRNAPILLVEDDPLMVVNLLQAMEALGMENPVHVASSGKDALDMVQGRERAPLSPTPKIILLDLGLTDMGGFRFLEEIRKDDRLRSCCVFVITDAGTQKDIQKAYDYHVAGLIIKPLPYNSLQEVVATLQSYWDLIELPN